MMTRITNTNSTPVTLPPPFRGVLAPGASVVANVALATAVTDLGPSGLPATGIKLEEVPDQVTSSYWYPYP
jgi:hypothetical protein